MGGRPRSCASACEELHEFNPMLGHRGCRLAISYPEIAEMQARAIFEAAVEAAAQTGAPVVPEVMVPLVGHKAELDSSRRASTRWRGVMAETGAGRSTIRSAP
jgi:pyruvate, orthophosphate dikinase